jgi:hypothetical protein
LWKDNDGKLSSVDFIVKSFVKAETYPEYKHARGINSRTDMFKCAVGPIFKLIEEEVFKHPAFIKKVPISDRPKYIADRLARVGAEYFCGDFTAFESHFTKQIMKTIEIPMYTYMVQHLSEGAYFLNLVNNVIAGTNLCKYGHFNVTVEARRMSGEMNTSLGNGFTNLMLILFLFQEKGEIVDPVVEGDDSCVSFMHSHPTVEDFKRLGFTIKVETHKNFEEMSFCGLIFDSEDLLNITDPIDVLSSFGWASKFYVRCNSRRRRTLLRCKALSYAHQYPGCPIIQSLAHYALRVTKSIDIRHFVYNDRGINGYERDELISILDNGSGRIKSRIEPIEVPPRTRLLMERVFGIPVAQQKQIEEYLDSLDELQSLGGPISELNFGVFRQYFDSYCTEIHKWNDLDTFKI